MPGHTFLYSPAVTIIKEPDRLGRAGRDLLHLVESRQPRASSARCERGLGPRPARLLDPALLARRSAVRGFGRQPQLPAPGTFRTSPSSTSRYASGTVAHVELSWLAPSKLRRTAIVGSREDGRLRRHHRPSPCASSTRALSSPTPETFGEYQLSYRSGDIVSPRIEASEPLSLELTDFAQAIVEGTPLVSSAAVGLDVVRTIEAVDRSLAQGGGPVPLDEAKEKPLPEELFERLEVLRLDDPVREPPAGGARGFGRHRHPRGRSRRADGCVHSRSARAARGGLRGGRDGRRDRKDGRVRRLPLRPRRPPVLHEARASSAAVGGDARRGVPDPTTALPDLLRRQVLRLPAHRQGRRRPARALGVDALRALVPLGAARHRKDEAHTFEEWVTTRFGRRLYDAFFRSYTEKVWGIPGSQIRSLWAAQRIKNFSLWRAILTILGLRSNDVTTLIEEFRYPRLGPGQMWEAFAEHAEENSIGVHLKQRVRPHQARGRPSELDRRAAERRHLRTLPSIR